MWIRKTDTGLAEFERNLDTVFKLVDDGEATPIDRLPPRPVADAPAEVSPKPGKRRSPVKRAAT